ncbi:uncharacterized protein BDV17DRAFT_279016 [Aspergillus undulatus]|uniref:uncharacterized protein n=1 Tax=Aspergillus undulatus TaxID=1810928 RepID=UPI003CCD7200
MPPSVLITGCSASGIGSALVEEFRAKGLHVYATARPSINRAKKQSGHLDILINNARYSMVMPALDSRIEDSKGFFDVNFFGVLTTTQAFPPLITADKGSVVNMCSISGFLNAAWGTGAARHESSFGDVSVVSGSTDTNINPHPDLSPHEKSFYHKAIENIQTRESGQGPLPKTASADFAKKVMGDVLSGASGSVWRGAMASMVRIVVSLAPTSLVDHLVKSGIVLERLP